TSFASWVPLSSTQARLPVAVSGAEPLSGLERNPRRHRRAVRAAARVRRMDLDVAADERVLGLVDHGTGHLPLRVVHQADGEVIGVGEAALRRVRLVPGLAVILGDHVEPVAGVPLAVRAPLRRAAEVDLVHLEALLAAGLARA